MDRMTYNDIIDTQIRICKDVLVDKNREYAGDVDPIRNFQVAARLEKTTLRQALAGMMAKHTVSIYDMCESDEIFDMDKWTEKITDHVNFLLLLKVVLIEEFLESASVEVSQYTLYGDGAPVKTGTTEEFKDSIRLNVPAAYDPSTEAYKKAQARFQAMTGQVKVDPNA